jgi:hypothetical protein
MKRVAIIAAVLAAAGASIAVLAGGVGAQQPGGRTFTVLEHNKGSTFNFVDNPPKSRTPRNREPRVSIGDLVAFSQPFTRQDNGKPGELEVTCTATRASRRFELAQFICHGAARLDDGTISLETPLKFGNSRHVDVAITGGTGAYDGARGTMVHDESTKPNKNTFELLP